MGAKPDFTGYATKVGLVCTDGRTIMPDAFKHQDKHKVPLVWQHSHDDPENVLGHVILTNRDDGVHVKAYFNKSKRAAAAKEAIEHQDINQMSIWANKLTERAKQVLHGTIREVSLVLAGANPGALIDTVTLTHGDGTSDVLEDTIIVYTGELIHTADEDDEDENDDDDGDEDEDKEEDVSHADTDTMDVSDETLIKDIYNTMDDAQKTVTSYLISEGIAAAKAGTVDNEDDEKDDPSAEHTDIDEKEDTTMKHNVFEDKGTGATGPVLSHDDIKAIVDDAKRGGSLKHAVERYAEEHLEHGLNDIDVLFPDAKLINNEPELESRRMEWVQAVLSAARKSPFARIRTMSADITEDEARAKGYVTGEFKREEFFGLTKRETVPQTVYKKQKLERDDIIDITDFDVVTWLKREMRVMLDEEIARAALIGDGRDIAHTDKISETNIRPVATDHELYTTRVEVDLSGDSNIQTLIDAIVLNRSLYKGTGQPTLYTSESIIARISLIKDGVGRRLYPSLADFASEIRVKEVVPVEAMDDEEDIIAILVNMTDYNFGTDRGGEVNMFDDFDIDYNNYTYLIETRLSGALVRLKSAIVYVQADDADVLVTPDSPTFNVETGVLTVPAETGVSYFNGDTDVEFSSGAQTAIAADAIIRVYATADSGYYFPPTAKKKWSFQRNSA